MQITDLPVADQSSPDGSPRTPRTREAEREERRVKKWTVVLADWPSYEMNNPGRLAQYLRDGVPNQLRPQVWREVTKTKQFGANFGTDVYRKLREMRGQYDDKIELDLHRTFPNHSLFKDKGGEGQSSLRNVMCAYSNYDSYVGYCQGMSFLAALLLMHLSEEDTFFALVQIMNKHHLRPTYQPGLPGLSLLMAEFTYHIKYCLPEVHTHLEEHEVRPEMFAANWFITVFVYQFPLPVVLHVWDVFLFEGMEIVFRVSLAILKLLKDEILKLGFEEILVLLKHIPAQVMNGTRLVLAALNIQLDQPHLDSFLLHYREAVPSCQSDHQEPPRPRNMLPPPRVPKDGLARAAVPPGEEGWGEAVVGLVGSSAALLVSPWRWIARGDSDGKEGEGGRGREGR